MHMQRFGHVPPHAILFLSFLSKYTESLFVPFIYAQIPVPNLLLLDEIFQPNAQKLARKLDMTSNFP